MMNSQITKKITPFLVMFLLISPCTLYAGLKKVLVLDFINIEKKAEFEYLEESITDAINKMLKEQFAFKTPSQKKWETIAKENYLFRRDYYTYSVSMNIGLLTKQDIVISGGFRIKKEKNDLIIITNVQILDIGNRNAIKEFEEAGPADNRIFNSIEKIAQRIAKEASSVLPNKDEWEKSGMEDNDTEPFFSDFTIGLRSGYALYSAGIADRIKARQPLLSINMSANLPVIYESLAFQMEAANLVHKPVKKENPVIEEYTVQFNNYVFG